jgi:hypothetical protein
MTETPMAGAGLTPGRWMGRFGNTTKRPVAMLVDSPTLQAGCGDPDAVG